MMKKSLWLIYLFSILSGFSEAQNFTKITSGQIVTDGGASRAVGWIDIDQDGYLDLYITNGLEGGENNFLYLNNRNGSFTKITNSPLVSDGKPSDGASWGDYDNDGDPDVVVAAWYNSNNLLFMNQGGGAFICIDTSIIARDLGYSETCCWGDYDNDGFLDLYVSNSAGNRKNFLYRNNTGNLFLRVNDGNITNDGFYSRGVTWIDYDGDGDQDMFVVNENEQKNNLYKNMLKETGTATFSKVTTGDLVNDLASSMSASWGDYDNDGDPDVFIANGYPYAQNDNLYKNNGDGTFTKITEGPIVNTGAFSMGSAWGDFDNDGDLDLFVTTAFAGSPSTNILYKNTLMETDTARFERILSGDIANDSGYAYGCAWGDYDRDGDLDLFIAKTWNENENNALYRNDNANGNHWLVVRCVGDSSNRSGIGAKIRIKSQINGRTVRQLRIVEGQSGYCGQNLESHFGLGNSQTIDSLTIEWPSGRVDKLSAIAADRLITITEGGNITSVYDLYHGNKVPFYLEQNYPNPFNPSTIINYQLPITSKVNLKIHNSLGQVVATLIDRYQAAGQHQVQWNGKDFAGNTVASGLYFYRIEALSDKGRFTDVKKMLFLK